MDDVTCSECLGSVPAGATICPVCGNRIEQPAQAAPTRTSSTGPGVGADPFAEVDSAIQLYVSSPRGERTISLGVGDRLEIGREVGPLTDLCTDNLSAHHAEISVGDDGVEITDTGRGRQGSTNGTFVEGRRLVPNVGVRLVDGSVVTCGSDPPLTIRMSGAAR